ncbi:MAG: helix-turn-helix domain-containing protein, partial [Desulfovibrio sp.]|nr:helix-turn-helix domain-containing protein [Desulfovibrio sp.]
MDTFVPKGNISGPILPEFVLKLSITAGAKLMYSILCWHAYDKDYCWPSYSKLAERMNCSINSIKNYFRELVKAKLVLVQKESYRSSKYFLLKPSEEMGNDSRREHCAENLVSPQDANLSNFDGNPPKFGENPSNVGYL